MDNSIDPTRFEKIEEDKCPLMSGTLWKWNLPADWRDLNPSWVGEFLSKIWAHYGPPNQVTYEGFTYCFLDREMGMKFIAYCPGSGPAFAGDFRKYDNTNGFTILEKEFNSLTLSVKAFEKLLENTTPIDCEIEYDTDFSVYRAGARNGIPFDQPIEEN